MRYPSTLPLFFLMVLCNIHLIKAAETPIVITANEHTTVALFFPSKIVKVIQPAANFTFGYVLNDVSATLNATEGVPSNLTVITGDGLIYSFELKYAEKIEAFTWVLKKEHAIGKTSSNTRTTLTNADTASIGNSSENRGDKKINPNVYASENKEIPKPGMKSLRKQKKDKNTFGGGDLYDLERKSYYAIFCENNYLQEPLLDSSSENSSRIVLRLNNIQKDRNETYFSITITNNSDIPYQPKRVLFFIKTKGEKTHMKLEPLYAFNEKSSIPIGAKNNQMHVYNDFMLGKKQQLYIMVEELGGSRAVVLPLGKEASYFY